MNFHLFPHHEKGIIMQSFHVLEIFSRIPEEQDWMKKVFVTNIGGILSGGNMLAMLMMLLIMRMMML